MPYDFYWISGSPNAWRAKLVLDYKGIDYVSHRLDPSKGDTKTGEFLALNPRAKVPVLKAGDTVIFESIAIMAYLEAAHPARPLFGTDPSETGLIWQRIFEVVNYTRDPIEEGVVRPLFRGESRTAPSRLQDGARAAHDAIAWVEDVLAGSPYLAGADLSAADVAAATTFQVLARTGRRPDAVDLDLGFDAMTERYPAIGAWLDRVSRMDGWEAAYPPHWKS